MNINTLADLYQYFDQLVDGEIEHQDESGFAMDNIADILFASSYVRGFIALEAASFGDEQQALSSQLAEQVTAKLADARNELTPQDQQIVANFWHGLQKIFK